MVFWQEFFAAKIFCRNLCCNYHKNAVCRPLTRLFAVTEQSPSVRRRPGFAKADGLCYNAFVESIPKKELLS